MAATRRYLKRKLREDSSTAHNQPQEVDPLIQQGIKLLIGEGEQVDTQDSTTDDTPRSSTSGRARGRILNLVRDASTGLRKVKGYRSGSSRTKKNGPSPGTVNRADTDTTDQLAGAADEETDVEEEADADSIGKVNSP